MTTKRSAFLPRALRIGGKLVALAPLLVAAAPACGSDSSSNNNGACKSGDTRPCTGPGACNGGQLCGPNAQWSACDCGGAGGSGGGVAGSGGSGGTGATGATGGTSGGGTGGAGGTSGDSGLGGSAGSPWQDDPCPTPSAFIDCSNQCSGPSANCSQSTCATSLYEKTDYPQFPYVIRTPSKPGVDPKCTAACTPPSTTFGIGLDLNIKIDNTKGLKVTVPKPWWIRWDQGGFADPTYFCMSPGTPGLAQDCLIVPTNNATVLILTDEPNALSVNAVVDRITLPGSCP